MKKRLLAIILVLVMIVGTFTACEAKTKLSFWDTMRELQQVKTGSFSYEFHVKADTDELADETAADIFKDAYFKVDGVVTSSKAPYQMSLNVQYKLSEADEYIEVTDMIVDGEAVYLNINKLKTMLQGINNTMVSMYAGLLTSDQEYIKITMDDIQSLADLTGEEVDTEAMTIPSDITAYSTPFANKIYTLLEKSVKGVKPETITEKDGVYTFEINNENAVVFLTNLKATIDSDADALVTEYINEVKGKDGIDQAYLDEITENKDEEIANISTEIEQLITELGKNKEDVFNAVTTVECKGKEGKRTVNQTMSVKATQADGNNVDISLKGLVEEDIKDKKIEVPTDFVTLTDYINNLYSSLGLTE